MNTPNSFTYYYDPNHGYALVPSAGIEELRVPVSGYSPRIGTNYLLEEDCDFPLFLEYAEAMGWKVEVTSTYLDDVLAHFNIPRPRRTNSIS